MLRSVSDLAMQLAGGFDSGPAAILPAQTPTVTYVHPSVTVPIASSPRPSCRWAPAIRCFGWLCPAKSTRRLTAVPQSETTKRSSVERQKWVDKGISRQRRAGDWRALAELPGSARSVILFGAHADTRRSDVPGKAPFARLDENAPAGSAVAACNV